MDDGLPPFGGVAVLGLGVMGGSLCRALKAAPRPPRVLGWSPDPAEVEAALAAGALDQGLSGPGEAFGRADLVVLAAPLSGCLDLLGSAGGVRPGALVTDVASLKVPLADRAAEVGLRDRWVGSHPMCGSASSGFAASDASLYQGARVWLCAFGEAGPQVERLRRFWTSVGGDAVLTDPVVHDALMAQVSHLPQLVANALATTLLEAGIAAQSLGPGGRDMTRLAGSSPQVWRDILAHAPAELAGHLRRVAHHLEGLADLQAAGDVEGVAEWMSRTRAWRDPR